MKLLVSLLALVFTLALAAPMVMGQDEVMTLNSAGEAANQRPLVVFNHGTHAEIFDCANCHHEYDENFNKTGSEGGNCAECHKPGATAENSMPLNLAYHQQCKSCHVRFIELDKKSGPVMCGDCHVKKK